jgi:hypothetical protein
MASGHLKGHRPMFPEYKINRQGTRRELFGLERGRIFDRYGNTTPIRNYKDVRNFMETNSCMLVTDLHNDTNFLFDSTGDIRNSTLCDKDGKPFLTRASATGRQRRSNTWIVRTDLWADILSPRMLGNMADLFDYCGVDACPTTGSLGMRLMRMSMKDHRHTSPSIACELFFREHGIGGIVQTPGLHKYYSEALELDMCSAWLSTFTELPTGTPVRIGPRGAANYKHYYVKCDIHIRNDLPLGPFPIRKKKGGKVQWPTKEGYYEGVYLWNFQIEDCLRAGCNVSLSHGWGWERTTTDTLPWSQQMYDFRIKAPTDFIEKSCKAGAVSAIGHHGMSRETFELVTRDRADDTCRPVLDNAGNALDLWIREGFNWNVATMVHWRDYTISMCNSIVYNFALPFAREGRLIAIDYDAILIEEKEETKTFIRKKSIESLQQRPGTWMWTKLHQVRIDAARAYTSLEQIKRPGVKQHSALDKHIAAML